MCTASLPVSKRGEASNEGEHFFATLFFLLDVELNVAILRGNPVWANAAVFKYVYTFFFPFIIVSNM